MQVNCIITMVATIESTKYLYNCFWILGIHMPKTYKLLYVIYSASLNIFITLFLPISFTISFLRISTKTLDLGPLFTSLQVAIDVYGCSTKIYIMAFLLRKLRAVDKLLIYLDARCQEEDEIAYLYKIRNFGRKFVVFLSVIYFSYSTSTYLGSLTMNRPPYSLYLPYLDWKRSTWEFYLTSFIEFFMMDVAVVQQIADDSYPVIYVRILHTHLHILGLRIKKLGSNLTKTDEEHLNDLKMCIQDYKCIIELYNIIAPVISITLFVQFMITAAILGTTLINIMLFATEFSSRIGSLFYVLSVTMEIFPLCYYAQSLLTECERFSSIIFHSNWMTRNSSYRKMLIIFMQCAQKEILFTAGKLFPITLNSFFGIAKFSFSLYTLIKEMNIKEKLNK